MHRPLPLPLTAVVDYGPVGQGASLAHSVLAENGNEYLVKGPTINPALPYVASNELIAAALAEHCGLPLLDYRIISLQGDLLFGSSWMPGGTFYPAITEQLFTQCENPDRAYDVVVFDFFIYNTDRNQQNLVIRKGGRGVSGAKHLLLLNDHSHCLVQPNETPADLVPRTLVAPPVHLDFIRRYITDHNALSTAVGLVEGLNDDTLGEVVASIPPSLLSGPDGQVVEGVLKDRRNNLRDLVNQNLHVFPNFSGGSI